MAKEKNNVEQLQTTRFKHIVTTFRSLPQVEGIEPIIYELKLYKDCWISSYKQAIEQKEHLNKKYLQIKWQNLKLKKLRKEHYELKESLQHKDQKIRNYIFCQNQRIFKKNVLDMVSTNFLLTQRNKSKDYAIQCGETITEQNIKFQKLTSRCQEMKLSIERFQNERNQICQRLQFFIELLSRSGINSKQQENDENQMGQLEEFQFDQISQDSDYEDYISDNDKSQLKDQQQSQNWVLTKKNDNLEVKLEDESKNYKTNTLERQVFQIALKNLLTFFERN